MLAAHTTKRHMNLISVIVFVSCLLLVSGNTVFAIPYLQLDAEGGIYVGPPEESVVIASDQFTLYALVDSSHGSTDGVFFLSIALVPQLDTATDLGFFMIDGDVINVTSDMTYGIPPLNLLIEALPEDPQNPGLLAPHGIFETYFYELEFTLAGATQTDPYNVQYNPGGPGENVPGGVLYYQAFDIDATNLSDDYFLHFDLYTTGSGIVDFAPFSKDVQHTPVPGAVLLGILGLGVAGLKLRKFA